MSVRAVVEFFVHMSDYVSIEHNSRGHVSDWIWRRLHIYVHVAIKWRQTANGYKISTPKGHAQNKVRNGSFKGKQNKNMPAASELTRDFTTSLSVNAISASGRNARLESSV